MWAIRSLVVAKDADKVVCSRALVVVVEDGLVLLEERSSPPFHAQARYQQTEQTEVVARARLHHKGHHRACHLL